MKKIKILFAALLSALCLLIPFTGCKNNPTSNYNVDFDYKLLTSTNSLSNDKEGSLECRLKITLPNASSGNYKITYTLNVYADGLIIAKERFSKKFTINRFQENKASVFSFDKKLGDVKNVKKVTAKIVNIKIDKASKTNTYTSYAIGFGVTSGVILLSAVVVFILDKKGILVKRK